MDPNQNPFAKVVRSMPQLVALLDAKLVATWVNPAFIKVTGHPSDHAVGRRLVDLLVTDNQVCGLPSALEGLLEQPGKLQMHHAVQSHLGTTVWLDLDLQPDYNSSGALDGYVLIGNDITEQKTTTEQLGQALRDSQTLMDAIDHHAMVSIADLAGNITYVNERFVQTSGYEAEELLGNNHRLLKSSAQDASFWRSMWADITRGKVWRNVVCNRAKDGSHYWVDTLIAPFVSDAGIEKYIAIRTDITAFKNTQDALATERERLTHIIQGTNAGTWEWHVPTGDVAINPRFAEIVGHSVEELAPMSLNRWASMSNPDDFAAITALQTQRQSGPLSLCDGSLRVLGKDSKWIWIHVMGKVSSWAPDGTALLASGTILDITGQKKAEEEIAHTSLMLQSVLDSASEVGLITSRFDGQITLFSKGAEKMLGYSAAEVVNQHSSALYLDPDEIDIWIDAMSMKPRPTHGDLPGTLSTDIPSNKTELNFIRKDGQRIRVELVVTPMFSSGGVPTGYLSICHDVTQQRAYETQLRQAMESAQAAAVAKSQFLANMSHEIRTPMNAILGMLQVLQTTDLSVSQHDYASKAESAANSLLGLLNDVLDFSKIDADKMTLDLQPFRLDKLMRELAVILAGYAGNKTVEVLFDIDTAVPIALVGDSLRLQQVLINLSANAIKFTPEGEVVVQIRVVDKSAMHCTLLVTVQDTGIGIEPDNLRHIFDDFSQAEASTTRRFGGTGLGLTISRRLVGLMGGELSVRSTVGKGSDFYFNLTLPQVEPGNTMQVSDGSHGLHGLHALLVDDNAVARRLLSAMTQAWGWHAVSVSSGAEALAQVQARAARGEPAFQVLVVDSRMPDMDGWQTISAIYQQCKPDALPICVMLSAHGQHELSQRSAQEQGMLHAFLSKPITPSMLFDAVSQAIAARLKPITTNPAKAVKVQRLKGIRLLVVEDNVVNQQVAQQLLKAEGAIVQLASNGQLGLDAITSAPLPFDAVLMDLQMPVMDGLTAAKAIRQQLGLSQMPVIAMTANAMASDREACLAAGMNDHVGKPFKIAGLVEVLQRHIPSIQPTQVQA